MLLTVIYCVAVRRRTDRQSLQNSVTLCAHVACSDVRLLITQ